MEIINAERSNDKCLNQTHKSNSNIIKFDSNNISNTKDKNQSISQKQNKNESSSCKCSCNDHKCNLSNDNSLKSINSEKCSRCENCVNLNEDSLNNSFIKGINKYVY